MSISYFLKYLWQKKWLILVPTLIAVIVAGLLARQKKLTYTSVAELSTGYMEINPLDNSARNFNNTVLFNNVIQTLRSNQILDQVSYNLLLHDLQDKVPFRKVEDPNRLSSILTSYPGSKEGMVSSLTQKIDSFYVLNLEKDEDRIIRQVAGMYGYSPDAILGGVQIKRIEGSDFINITYTSENPKLSSFIPNAICKTFLSFYQSTQGQASASSLDTLKRIMDTKKQLLDNKLMMLQGGDNLSANSLGMLANLQAQLTQQKGDLIAAQVALDNVNSQISAAGKPGSGLANNEDIISLRSNIDNLYARYVNGGSKDEDLLEQINRLRSDLQQKLSAVGGNTGVVSQSDLMKQKMDLEVKVTVAKQTMQDLQSKINSLTGAVQSSASKEGMIQGLQNEIDIARQEYSNATNLYNEALNRDIFPGNSFRQALIASPPLYPNPPETLKTIGFVGAGVFFLIVFLLLLIEFINPNIKSPSSLKEGISFPLLANLERINAKALPAGQTFSLNGSLPDHGKKYWEQIKQLRFEVENSGKKIFLVAGYHAGSGRTTLIRSLAASLSLNKKRVLLIDANFQNNTLTREYNAEFYLENFQLNGSTIDNEKAKRIKEVVSETGDQNIQIIGCGSSDHTPREVLPERNIFDYLRASEAIYDYIFIDCASLIKGPDSKELLQYADSVILVFAADQSLVEEDDKFMDFLKRQDTHILGVVLNRVETYHMSL